MDKRVEPRTVKGFQDLLPAEVAARRAVVNVMVEVFERYGFVPLDSPAVEYLDTLLGTGGEETNKELFRLETPEGEQAALRFDQTVPFSRLMAQYPDKFKAPFRRYAIGKVWRGDKPGPWRFREFTQVDVDAAGANTVAADAEMIAVATEILRKLGATRCQVLINNRKLVDALLEDCGIVEEARIKHVLRVIDKLEKVGVDNVRLEFGPGRIDDSGDPIPGVGLDDATIDRILEFVAVRADSRADVIAALKSVLPDSETARVALDEMRELEACLAALDVSEENACFLPSLARGLDYYTGPIFEITMPGAGQLGSVGGGGRYDGLVERFLDRPIACTGISFGIDRLMGALAALDIMPGEAPGPQVLIVAMGQVPKAESLRIAAELRAAGIRTEAYFGKKRGMGQQLSHADRCDIPLAIVVGEDEIAKGDVSIKDLLAGKEQRADIEDRDAYRKAGRVSQVTVPREDMVGTVNQMLDAVGESNA